LQKEGLESGSNQIDKSSIPDQAGRFQLFTVAAASNIGTRLISDF
jgi:hypothetical protein